MTKLFVSVGLAVLVIVVLGLLPAAIVDFPAKLIDVAIKRFKEKFPEGEVIYAG